MDRRKGEVRVRAESGLIEVAQAPSRKTRGGVAAVERHLEHSPCVERLQLARTATPDKHAVGGARS